MNHDKVFKITFFVVYFFEKETGYFFISVVGKNQVGSVSDKSNQSNDYRRNGI